MNGAILQQVFVVEFVIQYQMCDDCHRVEAKDFWKAVVQVRQKVGVRGLMIQKKIFFFQIFIICSFILPDSHIFKYCACMSYA